ncbi:MAG: hypothetical protein QGG36_05555, partial [Pirellulaceae bacterium]|nr:hypothetical protein [Pirellulaceae bacterium]
DLQVTQYELLIDRTDLQPGERTKFAKELADLYAAQLMAASSDQVKYNDTFRRIQALISKAPDANTPSLEVMLLQADYNRAESLVSTWIADRSQQAAKKEATEILARIAPTLDDRQLQLNAQTEALLKEIDELNDGDRRVAAKERELRRIQAVAGRATYFAAWSKYYHGLVAGGDSFQRAQVLFRQILGVEEEEYDEVEVEWLALESVWRARALVGLGLAEAAIGNLKGSRTCFEWLRHASVTPEIQDQAPYWFVRGLLNSGRLAEAAEFARGEIATYNGNATQGKVSLCVALVRAAYADGAPTTPDLTRLAGLGVEGLAKLRQQKAIDQLVEKHGVKLTGGGFYLSWVRARKLIAQAKDEEDGEAKYREAATILEGALRAPEAKNNAGAASQCRYELAWCYYKLDEYEKAGGHYEQSLTALKASGDSSAIDAAWMAFVSYNKIAKDELRFATRAIEVLRGIKRDFPDHEYAKKADYFISKLRRSGASPRDSMRQLGAVKPESPNYLAARYDMCMIAHQQWRESKDGARKSWAAELTNAVDTFVAAAQRDSSQKSRVLKAHLMTADLFINGDAADLAKAQTALSRAKPLAAATASSDSTVAEYHFRELQLASQTGAAPARKLHAAWLVENASGGSYELPALIVVAKGLEAQMATAAGPAAQRVRGELISIYQRLVMRLGDSPNALAANKNARAASSRLAEYMAAANQHEQASRQLRKLLAAFPSDKGYLRRAGVSLFRSGDFEASLNYWRTLVNGLPRGGEPWCEAKYHQLACLARIDKGKASKALRQYKLLYPNFGAAAWRTQFTKLEADLKGS